MHAHQNQIEVIIVIKRYCLIAIPCLCDSMAMSFQNQPQQTQILLDIIDNQYTFGVYDGG